VPASASTACFATRCKASGTICIPLKAVELGAPKAAVGPVEVDEAADIALLELRLLIALLEDEDDLEEEEDLEEED
jgi:hypothetical protein